MLGSDQVPALKQENAEVAVREMLQQFSQAHGLASVGTVKAEDCMDDGTPICLAVTIGMTVQGHSFIKL